MEWIEIQLMLRLMSYLPSPSLRGSGLKLSLQRIQTEYRIVSLFTREWIEIHAEGYSTQASGVSLFTREWIEMLVIVRRVSAAPVSLFTREWIEISGSLKSGSTGLCLPLYEGVD